MVTHISDADVMAAEEHMQELRAEAYTEQLLAEAHATIEPPRSVVWLRTMVVRLVRWVRRVPRRV